MNWDAIGAIAEMIGAFGVIASMGYLAVQIRASNNLARSEAKIAATSQISSLLDSFISEPESSDIWARGRRNLQDLTPEERSRFDNIAMKGFLGYSSQYFQFRIQTIEQDDWTESYRAMIWWLQGRGMRDWWRDFGRRIQSDRFQEFVDDEIRLIEDDAEQSPVERRMNNDDA
jgi:hypothetical protein